MMMVLPPMQETWIGSWLLALALPSPGYGSQLENESADQRFWFSVPLPSHSLPQIYLFI